MIHRDEIGFKILTPIVKTYFKLVYKPTVYGKENIPKTGPVIFCGNHMHTHDQFNVMYRSGYPHAQDPRTRRLPRGQYCQALRSGFSARYSSGMAQRLRRTVS